MKRPLKNMADSVKARLLALSNKRGEDFQRMLDRFALERLLYRLSRSGGGDRFILKGAMLLELWREELSRPTRDLDLLGLTESTPEAVRDFFKELCVLDVEDDGLIFLPDSVEAQVIRDPAEAVGVRVTLSARLGQARMRLQTDIGFGDAVIPEPEEAEYPVLLDLPRPKLKVYPLEAVVAEKFQAMNYHGDTNSRMKDYYDLWVIGHRMPFGGRRLSQAIQATFQRRNAAIPGTVPEGLREELLIAQRTMWEGFHRKNALREPFRPFPEILAFLVSFLMPAASALHAGRSFDAEWPPGGPWCEKQKGKEKAHT
jgi:predicted nucleotidyltransferase component of viral defense system